MNNLGRFYILNGSYAQALDLLLPALERANEMLTKSDVHKNLGWLYWLKKDYTEAEFHLRKAIFLNDEKPDAYCLLAKVLSDIGDHIGAEDAAESCRIRYQPNPHKPEVETWVLALNSTTTSHLHKPEY